MTYICKFHWQVNGKDEIDKRKCQSEKEGRIEKVANGLASEMMMLDFSIMIQPCCTAYFIFSRSQSRV